MKFLKLVLGIVAFILLGILGLFVGELLSNISIIPSTIDKDSIKYCSSILLANIGYFVLASSESKVNSIVNIILNIIYAVIITIIFGFNSLIAISLLLIIFVGYQIYNLIEKVC